MPRCMSVGTSPALPSALDWAGRPTGSYSHGVQSRGHLLYWEERSAFIAGEPSVQDGSVYCFTVLDRLLQQAFQTFPNLATVTVAVSTQPHSPCCDASRKAK